MKHLNNMDFAKTLIQSFSRQESLEENCLQTLQSLIQLEMMNVIEKSKTIALKDRRSRIYQSDIQLAMNQLNHCDLYISKRNNKDADKKLTSNDVVKNCLSDLKIRKDPTHQGIKGLWLYVNGVVPSQPELQNFRELSKEEIELQDIQQYLCPYNQIKSEELKIMTKQQSDNLAYLLMDLKDNNTESKRLRFQANHSKIVIPLLRSIKMDPNQAGITCLLSLLQNVHVSHLMDASIHHVFHILLTYRGEMIIQASKTIVSLVKKYMKSQPLLVNLMDGYEGNIYCAVKALYFEKEFQVQVLNGKIQHYIRLAQRKCGNYKIYGIWQKILSQLLTEIPSFWQQRPSWPIFLPIQLQNGLSKDRFLQNF